MQFDSGRDTKEFTKSGFQLIVGADGTWSRVRPMVSPIKPYYSGVLMSRLTLADAERTYPEAWKLVNRGSLFTYGQNNSLMAQQIGDGSIAVSTAYLAPEDEIKSLDVHSIETMKKVALDRFDDYCPQLTSMIEKTSGEPWVANLYMLPLGHRWAHREGFTLLGDAAHAMTPFAGEGVNLAMMDAMKLSEQIVDASKGSNLSDCIKAYEEDMFVRAPRVQQLTQSMVNTIFYSNSTKSRMIKDFMLNAMRPDVPALLFPLCQAAVHAYFWWYGLDEKAEVHGIVDKKAV